MRDVTARLHRSADSGFALVELLVVMVILGVVGAVTVAGVTSGLRTTSYAQARVETLTEAQTALERISREIRAGNPVREIADQTLTLDVCRDDELRHYRYTVEPVGDQWELVQQRWDFIRDCPAPDWDPVEADADRTSTRTLVRDLTDSVVFTALDRDGAELAGTAAENAEDAYRVVLRLQRQVQADREPIEAETTVTLRNPVGTR